MNTSPTSLLNRHWSGPASLLAGAVVAAYVGAVIVGREHTGTVEARAFFILWVLGLAMSILAGIRDQVTIAPPRVGWTYEPLMALGILAFILLPAVPIGNLLGWIPGYNGAFEWLAVIIAAKWVLAHLHFLARPPQASR